MRLRLVREPFDHPDYIFELKHDGFRAVVYLQARECKVISRNQRNLAFESLKKALAKLPVQTAILDGEIMCLDGNPHRGPRSYRRETLVSFWTSARLRCPSRARQ